MTTFQYTSLNAQQQEAALRAGLARAMSVVTAKATSETIASLTMANFIDEAIFELDSTQIDVAAQVESEAHASAKAELGSAVGRKGYRQRLEEIQALMMGQPETAEEPAVPGLIEAARDFDPHEIELVAVEDEVYATADSEDVP